MSHSETDTPSKEDAPLLFSSLLSTTSQTRDLSRYSVVKRNGMLVPFRRERIAMALEAAFRDTKKLERDESLPEEILRALYEITELVVEQALVQADSGAALTVEGIQDLVEMKLMQTGHHSVARDYIIYRDQHHALREDPLRLLRIQRQDGSSVRFKPIKVAASLQNAFRHALCLEGPLCEQTAHLVNALTNKVVQQALERAMRGQLLTTAFIQDEIERQLVADNHFDVAKYAILTRATRKGTQIVDELLPTAQDSTPIKEQRLFIISKDNGVSMKVSEEELHERIAYACRDLGPTVSSTAILQHSIGQFYEGMKEREIDLSNIMAARAKIEEEPLYSFIAARLLLDLLYRETLGTRAADSEILLEAHREYFKKYVPHAIGLGRLDPRLSSFDLDQLADVLDLERDLQFGYLGLQTLYDRYFLHDKQRRLETPQIFWMRVAMGLAIEEEERTQRAIDFYQVLSKFLYVSSTPTLFNAGTTHSQLSSCFLLTVMDDLAHIFKTIADDAQLSKWAGGIGNDWTNVRATGAPIKGTNGTSQGVIPFLKVANDTAVAVNQCFAPDTRVYTAKGTKAICDVHPGDLVLAIGGTYRTVTNAFAYNQKDPMVAIRVKHSLDSIVVTDAHPFYVIQGVPMEQSIERTLHWLEKRKVSCSWVEAKELKKGDYLAQVIPQEVVCIPNFDAEDAHLYGILLGDGHLSKDGMEWGVSGNPGCDTHLEFVRSYLRYRGIHFWTTSRGTTYLQIHWATGRGALREATTGRITGAGPSTLPFAREDLYDEKGCKWIAPRFSHLPRPQALALIQGLLETDGSVSRGKEITFCNTSLPLVEGLRYQLLRLSIPSSGKLRVRQQEHTGKRSDGTTIQFSQETTAYDLRIPAVSEIATLIGCRPLVKRNWLTVGNHLFTRVLDVKEAQITPFVFDLEVEGDASYMTTSGLAHNGGKRKGAMCAYLELWHLDIEDFLELRKNTGDDRRRTHDMNTAAWIPDLFFKRVLAGGHWTLFSPSDVPDLHDLYGTAFEQRYAEYEQWVEEGKITLTKRLEAVQLWRKVLSMLFETGHPWITFKDPSNIRSPQDHQGVIHSSNLCTEILLNTSAEETAVCNLGSINLARHIAKGGLDRTLLASTVRIAIRMLDNVIDLNFYPTAEAQRSNVRHRPVGLGLMGFQDVLYLLGISYASPEAVRFADESMELISYYALLASAELAKERGPYPSYRGSKWDRGILPIDSLQLLIQERGSEFVEIDTSSTLDWTPVREAIRRYGMRNSNTMALAPTATIANIVGVTPSIEPTYKHLYVKSNLSGEFTVPNIYLVTHLKQLGLWDAEMLDDLKYFDGSILEIERLPEKTKALFLTAFEIEPDWLIECASRRQKWIDQGQSLNLYLAEPSGKKMHTMYLMSWKKGLKTNYYCRTLGATQIEKSTTDINKRGLQPRWMKSKSASSNIRVERTKTKTPSQCNLEEGCESCQ